MVTSTQYQGVQVDSRYTPLKSLIQYLEGSSWIVNYYSQIIDSSDETGPQQSDQNPIYQQYLLIHELEMKVQQALTVTQDTESKESEVVGSAMMYPGVIPNKGDMFLADIGDGRAGIFTITTAEKKSILKDSAYRIDYTLIGYTDENKLNDLKRKTIQEAYFVKDYAKFGQNPVVLAPDFEKLIDLREVYKVLVNQYFADFFSHDFQTLIVPDQTSPTYDPFLVRAILQWVSTEEHPHIQRIRQHNVLSEPVMRIPTVWDVLTRMSKAMLPAVARQMKLVDTRIFRGPGEFAGVYYNGIEKVVYPVEGRTDGDRGHGLGSQTTGTNLTLGKYRWGDLHRRILVTELPGFTYLPQATDRLTDIALINELETYLFTENFYRGVGPFGSRLEVLMNDAINNRTIDGHILGSIAESTEQWASLERFYYIPVLIALLKVRIRKN